MANKQHKMYGTPTYKSWAEMKYRCGNPKRKYYQHISHCLRWNDFRLFFLDMGVRPFDKTLDRLNSYGDYCKENCRWSTPKEQARNKRKNTLLRGKTLSEWSELLGVKRSTLAQRYYVYGWSVNKVLLNLKK